MTAAYDHPVVDAPAGPVEGTAQGDVAAFKGIPYAQPPVGPLRWKPPVALPRWTGLRPCHDFGPACPQPQPKLSLIFADTSFPQSEDCLTLNIWAPKDVQNAPVLFWIYGGALSRGASCEGFYDGARLAARGVVVVSVNYRVGVFGFLAHPELSAENKAGLSGNYGLLDVIAALRWVQDNIATFGGDAGNVTVAGESAGALIAMYLMAAPEARGLFAKVIAQSAYMMSMPELKERRYGAASAEESGVQFAAALQAESVADLRAMDAGTLTEAASLAGFAPWIAVDGVTVPRQLVDVFDRGEQAPVPILAGFNSGEIRALRILASHPLASTAAYERIIRERYGEFAETFLRRYPAAAMNESILAATRDALYGWTSERLVRSQSRIGLPSYLYLFDHGYPAADAVGLHACHASEIPYVFGTFDGTPPLWPKVPETKDERRISDAMIGYWTSFAASGSPTAAGEPDWPVYAPAGSAMVFGQTPAVVAPLMPGMYEFHEAVVARRRAGGQPWNWNAGLWAPVLPR